MRRYLIFNEKATGVGDAAHDTVCYPLDRFLGITNKAGEEAPADQDIDMLFRSLSEPDNPASADKVAMVVAENKHMDAMKDIVRVINTAPNTDGAIVIFDAATGYSASEHITSIAITVQDASS